MVPILLGQSGTEFIQSATGVLQDTVLVGSQSGPTQDYIELLAKTNQQLSLWWNPYGVMVAALAVLFTILAIVAAIVIWRQGRDYRRLITNSIAEYTRVLDALLKERLSAMEDRLSETIEVEKEKLATATGEQRQLVEAKIEQLETRRKSIKETELPSIRFLSSRPTIISGSTGWPPIVEGSTQWVRPVSSGSSKYVFFVTCSRCGENFSADDSEIQHAGDGSRFFVCPKCGNHEQTTMP